MQGADLARALVGRGHGAHLPLGAAAGRLLLLLGKFPSNGPREEKRKLTPRQKTKGKDQPPPHLTIHQMKTVSHNMSKPHLSTLTTIRERASERESGTRTILCTVPDSGVTQTGSGWLLE